MVDFFDWEEEDRRRARVAAAAERNAVSAQQEAEAAAARKIKADQLTARANESFLRHQYETRGLRPPFVRPDGSPTVSLELLLQMGWQVENLGGELRALMRPLADPPRNRQRRQDYDQST